MMPMRFTANIAGQSYKFKKKRMRFLLLPAAQMSYGPYPRVRPRQWD